MVDSHRAGFLWKQPVSITRNGDIPPKWHPAIKAAPVGLSPNGFTVMPRVPANNSISLRSSLRYRYLLSRFRKLFRNHNQRSNLLCVLSNLI